LKNELENFLAEMKAQSRKVTEEYCWAITQEGERSCCKQSGSNVLYFVLQIDSRFYTYVLEQLTPNNVSQKNNYCLSSGVSLFPEQVHISDPSSQEFEKYAALGIGSFFNFSRTTV